MTNEWSLPGSRWWKFDFHTHTPASNDYGRGDETAKDITVEEWLRKAMLSGIDCVVVTDHNTGGWIDELKTTNKALQHNESKPDWYRELTIFPGVEITVADSNSRVHLLAIFDPDTDSRKVNGVLGSCGIMDGYGDDQQTSSKAGFLDCVQKINDANGIAMPAHIDGSKGLLNGISTLTPELSKSLNRIDCAEFCNLHYLDDKDSALMKAASRLAKVAGSDAHFPNHIGRHGSWIKMGSPTIEGLKLALQDHEYCVKNQEEDPNRVPDIFLTQLMIQNMRHCGRINGRPFVTMFHPHFNTLIGGRGTGKSTILESIRIASRRDQVLAAEAPRIKEDLDKFMHLSENKGVMLHDTQICLELFRRGKRFQLQWRFDGKGTVLSERDGDGWKGIEAGDLFDRFPISIFSQKQINELASNPRGLLEVIDRSKEVDRSEWNSRWKRVKSLLLQLRERKRALCRQLADAQQIRTKLGDVNHDLAQYEEKGHGEVLKQYQRRIQQQNSLPDDTVFTNFAHRLREVASSMTLSDFPSHLFDVGDETLTEMKEIHERSQAGIKRLEETLGGLAGEVDALLGQRKREVASSKWSQEVHNSINAYQELVKEYEQKKSQISISLYGEWVQQRNQLNQQLANLESTQKEAETTEHQIQEAMVSLQELRDELIGKRRRFLQKVIGTNLYVRMELVQYGDASSLESEYRSILNLDDGKFQSSIYDSENKLGLLWDLSNWEADKVPESQLPHLISQLKERTFGIAKGDTNGNHGAFDNRLKKLMENQPIVFDELDAWWPEDMLRVKYSKDPSMARFEDLEKGSAGQKAAAILAFLLSHGDEPIIIDQPEDDLDNALIYDLIVKQIHENKNRRQLIVVTHNPNIVVNGDAELVQVLKYEGGQIQIDKQGGLEEACIRASVCTIMEGGPQAFSKRYHRIMLEA